MVENVDEKRRETWTHPASRFLWRGWSWLGQSACRDLVLALRISANNHVNQRPPQTSNNLAPWIIAYIAPHAQCPASMIVLSEVYEYQVGHD